MRSETSEKSASRFGFETGFGETARRLYCMHAEPSHDKGMARKANRSQDVLLQDGPIGNERSHQTFIAVLIYAERLAGLLKRVLQDCGGAIVKGMGEGILRIYPFETMVMERKCAEERRRNRHGMYGRTYIVRKTWERQLIRACTAADLFQRLDHENG